MQLVLTFPITSIIGYRIFSLLKRILHYKRCSMTEGRLTYLALIAVHPTRLSELITEQIIKMFVQANPRKLKYRRVEECEVGVNFKEILFYRKFNFLMML